jgi:hypothetical protein
MTNNESVYDKVCNYIMIHHKMEFMAHNYLSEGSLHM